MSADTTVVIAAYRHPGDSELAYTAAVVYAADDLTDMLKPGAKWVMERAKDIFLNHRREWFSGKGGLSRAKQFANLLAMEMRENGILEYEDRPIIEIGEDRIYLLSRRGKRLPEKTVHIPSAASDPYANSWIANAETAFG